MLQDTARQIRGMIRIYICCLGAILLMRCRNIKDDSAIGRTDTLSAKQFFIDKDVCSMATAKNFKETRPQMIPWATDPKDPYSESYVIDNQKLTIRQPLKRFDLPDSNRRYFYGGKEINTVRVISDTLNFNFNSVAFDYGYSPQNIFRSEQFILLRNEPDAWCGLSNRYRFIQLFDLNKMVCYEFFVDYYACLTQKDGR